MITIKCIICGCKISSPKVDQLCCSKPNCVEKYTKLQQDSWRIKNPDKIKKMNRDYYIKKKK